MEVGEIVKFHGRFEYGKTVVGTFAGVDSTTGYLKFTDIASEECLYDNWAEIKPDYERNKKIPDNYLRHRVAMYNPAYVEAMYPMKTYRVEQ